MTWDAAEKSDGQKGGKGGLGGLRTGPKGGVTSCRLKAA